MRCHVVSRPCCVLKQACKQIQDLLVPKEEVVRNIVVVVILLLAFLDCPHTFLVVYDHH